MTDDWRPGTRERGVAGRTAVLVALLAALLAPGCGPTPTRPAETPAPRPPVPSSTPTARPAPANTATASPATATRVGVTVTPIVATAPAGSPPTATAAPTPMPTSTPPATSTPTGPPAATIRTTEVTLQAYPYQGFLADAVDQASGIAFKRLNWPAYEASGPRPAPRRFTAVVLENDTLQMILLPELGGRLYRVVHKPTGRDVFYVNPVLKPTRWGPAQQGWWLAAGGMEWAFPVDEHGLEWGTPWEYSAGRAAGGVAVTLWDSRAADRLRARVTVGLPDSGAGFTLAIVLENPTATPRRYQFWINAMLSGPGNRVSAETSFVLPTGQVIVHSTDDPTLPPRSVIPWPVVQGRDLTRYANWQGWLGIFAAQAAGRQGAYYAAGRFGVLRTYPPEVARGAKLFAGKGLSPSLWTDDGSTYVELWGGANRTFFPEDDLTLAPGASLEWTETWTVITAPPGP